MRDRLWLNGYQAVLAAPWQITQGNGSRIEFVDDFGLAATLNNLGFEAFLTLEDIQAAPPVRRVLAVWPEPVFGEGGGEPITDENGNIVLELHAEDALHHGGEVYEMATNQAPFDHVFPPGSRATLQVTAGAIQEITDRLAYLYGLIGGDAVWVARVENDAWVADFLNFDAFVNLDGSPYALPPVDGSCNRMILRCLNVSKYLPGGYRSVVLNAIPLTV